MDSMLIDYIRSGRAWVLVGSGPSIEMGYPTWQELAESLLHTTRQEVEDADLTRLERPLTDRDYPQAFDEASELLGSERMLQCLGERLSPSGRGRIYEYLARWPVDVYMTTNYDDEIQRHLVSAKESFTTFLSSEDHMSHLLPNCTHAVFKLHGDLRSRTGLVLTKSQYQNIEEGEQWEYWRTKMTSVFQMQPVVIVGHSLKDPNIRHVLEAARNGAGVQQPVCWIAPDVSHQERQKFLKEFRIRVIPYDNTDGRHLNLVRLIEHITDFVPPRISVRIASQIAQVSESRLKEDAAAPAFFVFNRVAQNTNLDEARVAVIMSALESVLPSLNKEGRLTFEDALEMAGWPRGVSLDPILLSELRSRAVAEKLLEPVGDTFRVNGSGLAAAMDKRERFALLRDHFKSSLAVRIRSKFPSLNPSQAADVASDIEASLTGYFREGGLSLASSLYSAGLQLPRSPIPASIIKFISEASARYPDLLRRQVFVTASVDSFARPEEVDREYLGRIAHGFMGFHVLGVCGGVAIERLKHARETVWLLDSETHIPALALAAPTNTAFASCFNRLKSIGVRLFTTEKLFEETYRHLIFACGMVTRYGDDSPSIMSAALGNPPFDKSNQFLQGFVQWQKAGNQCDWRSYLFAIFERRRPDRKHLESALKRLGIEVVPLESWPGFTQEDFGVRKAYTDKICGIDWVQEESAERLNALELDREKKAEPEAEALLIVKRESEGEYHILTPGQAPCSAWFVSHTSVLNHIDPNLRITWTPESFLSFASHLMPVSEEQLAEQSFQTLLWGIAQSGLCVLDDRVVTSVFGRVIDQANMGIQDERQNYDEILGSRYGEPVEALMARVPPVGQPMAALQLANQMAKEAVLAKKAALKAAKEADARARRAEKELAALAKFRQKMNEKLAANKKKSRKQQSQRKKKK